MKKPSQTIAERTLERLKSGAGETFWRYAIANAVLAVCQRDQALSINALIDQLRQDGSGKKRLDLGNGATFEMGGRIADEAIDRILKAVGADTDKHQ